MPTKSRQTNEPILRVLPSQRAAVRLTKRAAGDDAPGIIEGYGAVFYSADDPGTEFEMWPGLVERIMPGAFDETVADDDIRASFNHDLSALLGRTASETLRLSIDNVGLRYAIDTPNTEDGRKVCELVGRKDVNGSSIWFVATRVVWIEEEDRDIRQIEGIRLIEVGPVSMPAYDATTAATRSSDLESVKAELDAVRRQRASRQREIDYVNFRGRLARYDSDAGI